MFKGELDLEPFTFALEGRSPEQAGKPSHSQPYSLKVRAGGIAPDEEWKIL
jgi:hypothetical protein